MRSPESQSAHDLAVHLAAREYLQSGYQVQADARGYERPDPIYGYIPDVIAIRLGYGSPTVTEMVIVEVETEDSVTAYDAIAQADAFREAAAQDPNTRFEIRMA